jgi:CubicO group peptidase (beta-lactamase class C family)
MQNVAGASTEEMTAVSPLPDTATSLAGRIFSASSGSPCGILPGMSKKRRPPLQRDEMNTSPSVGVLHVWDQEALGQRHSVACRWLISIALLGSILPGLVTGHASGASITSDPGEAMELAGDWAGAVTTPVGKLEFLLTFTSNAAGVIAIPLQKVKDVPLERIAVDSGASPAKVTFKIKEVAGIGGDPTFSGQFSEDGTKISGEFAQGGGKFPFEITRGENRAKSTAESLAGLDEFFAKAIIDWKVPGMAVAIINGNEVVYAKGFGFRDLDRKLPVTENTLFPIGSATKAFTTFVMGQLADEGKLEFDTPVRTYLPELNLFDPVASERMTPRDLVTHRSGLPGHDLLWYGNTPRTRAELLKHLASLPNNKDLRVAWQYNNLMYMTAGVMEERLTGKTWEENIRERILTPLGMKRTTLNNTDSQKDSDFSLGYRLDADTDTVERMEFRDITTMGPAGSINSSVTEVANWVKLNLAEGEFAGKQLIQKPTLKDLQTPCMSMGSGADNPEIIPIGYAMGWFVDVYRGRRRIHHGGNIDGFSAMVALLPREDIGVVVLTNMNGTGLPEVAARHMIDRMTGASTIDWNAQSLAQNAAARAQGKQAKASLAATRKQGTQPSHPISEYVGRYEHPGYGILTVAPDANGAGLQFAFNGIVTPLEHWHYDIFSGKKAEEDRTFEAFKLNFDTGLDGEIAALSAQMVPTEEAFVFVRLGDEKLSDPNYLKKLVGEFAIESQPVKFAMSGPVLTATLPGQPVYELEPTRNNTFRIKTLPGFTIQFVPGEGGAFNEAKFVQPNGVFVAKRVGPQ